MPHRREKALIAFKPGEIIFHEGGGGNKLFIIQDGEVEITKQVDDEEVPLANLKIGAVFGEMALVDGSPRSATARAVTEVTCLSMSQTMFRHKLATEVPEWMQSLYGVTVDRLRMMILKSSFSGHDAPGRQIVELLAMFLQKGETTYSGNVYIPWDEATRKIAYILGFGEKPVTVVMDILTNSKLAGYEIALGEGRRFRVPSLDTFLQFAEYCEDSFMIDRRKREPDPDPGAKKQEHEFLSKICGLLEGQEGPVTLSAASLDRQLQKKFKYSLDTDRASLQRLLDQGLLGAETRDNGTLVYQIDLDLCKQRKTLFDMQGEFKKVQAKIMAYRPTKHQEGSGKASGPESTLRP